LYHCGRCGRFFGSPVTELTCRLCSKKTVTDEAAVESVYGYRIKQGLRSEVVAHCALEAKIADAVKKRGYEVFTSRTIQGRSGIEHHFDVCAWNGEFQLAIDIAASAGEVGLEQVIEFFSKVYDTRPRRSILVAIPEINKQAKRLADTYGIEVVHGLNVDEVAEKLLIVIGVGGDLASKPPMT